MGGANHVGVKLEIDERHAKCHQWLVYRQGQHIQDCNLKNQEAAGSMSELVMFWVVDSLVTALSLKLSVQMSIVDG